MTFSNWTESATLETMTPVRRDIIAAFFYEFHEITAARILKYYAEKISKNLEFCQNIGHLDSPPFTFVTSSNMGKGTQRSEPKHSFLKTPING
jgi:hypothetical protein